MTLPEDVIEALRARDHDLARAIVQLAAGDGRKPTPRLRTSPVGLAKVATRRFLITVDPNLVRRLPGCQFVPFGQGAAFLALEPGRGLADLILAVADRLTETGLRPSERHALRSLHAALKKWRQEPGVTYEIRSIVVLQRSREPIQAD